MTYKELRMIATGWVMTHIIDDECSNARFCYGKKWEAVSVPSYIIESLKEKAAHFGEAIILPEGIASSFVSETATHVRQ